MAVRGLALGRDARARGADRDTEFATACNDVLSAETTSMVKERLAFVHDTLLITSLLMGPIRPGGKMP